MSEAAAPSAHVDTFSLDRLPARADWPEFLFDLPELHYPELLNASRELLEGGLEKGWGERACLISAATGETWTYADLLARSNRLANRLVADYGLQPGNRVLLRGPNNPWLVALWFAVVRAGGVVVPTMPLLRGKELATICEIAAIDLAVCDHRFTEDLVSAEIPGLRVLTYGAPETGSDAADALPDVTLPDITLPDITGGLEEVSADFTAVPTRADDVVTLAFTSGTTGRPKATMHFHRDILANADTFSRHILKPTADDVFIGTPPIAFTFGLGGLVIFPLRVGASTVLVERATPAELAATIDRHHATVCFTAPTAYKAMLAGDGVDKLSGLRRAVSAGEHLPKSTWHAFAEATGLKLIDGIGSTEMLHIFISAADDDIRPGSTGKAIPGYRATTLQADGSEAPVGEPGRLAVKGPTGCRYLDDPRQAVYVQGGWNVTGDTFIRDEDGYFWYCARSDDMIVSSGYNISGPEVEEALSTHPAVLESAVVAAPDEDRGQVVMAYVVLREGYTASEELVAELQAHVKAEIAPFKYPRRVEFVAALPRTSTGKLQRFVLRQQAAEING